MSQRVQAFNIEFDALTMSDAVARCLELASRREQPVPFVVTPNVNHLVLLEKSSALRDAYANAALVVVDGKPVKKALQCFGHAIPETIPGSDLVPNIFSEASSGRTVSTFFLGAGPGVAVQAAANVMKQWPHVNVVGCYSPPFGFETDTEENRKITTMINEVNPDVLVVGLGAPKQEIWAASNCAQLKAGIVLCVGATIDFLAGEKSRAPAWMQKLSIEWLYRMISEPRRLAKRYAYDGMIFPALLYKEWARRNR